MKAASLLDGTGRTLQEGQFRKTIEDRTREPVWIVQDPLVGHRDEVTCAAWSPLEPHLLATGSHDGTVRLWDTKEDEVFEFTAHNSSILAVAWSSVQRGRLASGSHDGTIAVWDTTLKPEILKDHFLEGHGGAVNTLAWSPVNVAKLASGGSDKSVLLWSLGTGEFRELTGHTGAVTSLGWYPWCGPLPSPLLPLDKRR